MIQEIRRWCRTLHPLCRLAAGAVGGLAVCYLITALFAFYIAPLAPSYFRAILVSREAVCSACASLLVTVVVLVAGDSMLGHTDFDE